MGNLVGGVAVEHFDEESNDAFDNDGIRIGGVIDFAVLFLGVEPHAALATLDEVLWGFELLVNRRERVSEVNNHGVSIHPIVNFGEFLNDFVLYLVDSHK